jgi:hypothetical protein
VEEVSIKHFKFACQNQTLGCHIISVCLPVLWRSDCRLLVHFLPPDLLIFYLYPQAKLWVKIAKKEHKKAADACNAITDLKPCLAVSSMVVSHSM